MTDKNPYRTLHARMSPPGAAWDEGFAAGRAAATPPDGTNPHDDRNRMTKQLLRPSEVAEILGVTTRTVRALAERGELVKVKLGRRSARYQLADVEQFIARHVVTPDNEGWAARAAATPDPPAANPWRNINVNHLPSVKLRDAWDDGWAAHAAASPDERLREAGVWPDQSAMHGVLLDQIKDAYAEGIADTIDRIRVRAAEMLPEVARFTLDEIEALAAADREKPDEPIHQPDPVAADLGHPEVPDATTPEES